MVWFTNDDDGWGFVEVRIDLSMASPSRANLVAEVELVRTVGGVAGSLQISS